MTAHNNARGHEFNGLILVGPMGAGKDYILSKIQKAFIEAYVPTLSWQVGEFYYRHLSNEVGKSIKHIMLHKPEYRSRLQEIGSTEELVIKGVNATIMKYNALNHHHIFPVVVGRRTDEAHALKEWNAALVFIDANEDVRAERIYLRDKRMPTIEQLQHPVEPKLKDFVHMCDAVIDNNSNDDDFSVTVDPDRKVLIYENKNCNGEIAIKI